MDKAAISSHARKSSPRANELVTGLTHFCSTAAVVSFTFGGVSFNMKPSDLTFVPIDVNDLTGDCQSTISSGQIDNEGSWLIGDAWLKNVSLPLHEQSSDASYYDAI